MQHRDRSRFTLIELLVVIAIIAKFAHLSDRELPAYKGGNWYDQVHKADGQ